MATKVEVDLAALDPNVAGELLRDMAFKEPYGCYSCFDLEDDFVRFDCDDLFIRTLLCGCFAKVEEIFAARSAERDLEVFWHWDGDGTLVFRRGDLVLCNTDCKKDYEWEVVGPKSWAHEAMKMEGYYEESAA